MAGRPLTIGAETEMADAVLYSFHGGTMAGPGLANVITGKAVPSGRLPMTFPKMVGQIPAPVKARTSPLVITLWSALTIVMVLLYILFN